VFCCVGRSQNNIDQEKDNNANEIDEMASMLWDIIVSCESKHIRQMVTGRELMIVHWSL
jgi:hypothetical protein